MKRILIAVVATALLLGGGGFVSTASADHKHHGHHHHGHHHHHHGHGHHHHGHHHHGHWHHGHLHYYGPYNTYRPALVLPYAPGYSGGWQPYRGGIYVQQPRFGLHLGF